MAKKDMQYIMQTESSQILPIVRGKDGWLRDYYGKTVFPDDVYIKYNTEDEMCNTVNKADTMKGLIAAYKKLNSELKKEMIATVKDVKKIERCEKRLANLKASLLNYAEYIKNYMQLDIYDIVSEHVK